MVQELHLRSRAAHSVFRTGALLLCQPSAEITILDLRLTMALASESDSRHVQHYSQIVN